MKPRAARPRFVGEGLTIHAGMTRREARRAILKAGGQWLSGGSYAGVVTVGDGRRVVRISKPDRGAELAYEAFEAFPKDRRAPRIYGRVMLANGGMAVEVERLWRPEDQEVDGNHSSGADATRLRRELREEADGLGEALQTAAFRDGVGWDLHGDNVKYRRDGTAVVVDPLYSSTEIDQNSSASLAGSITSDAFSKCLRDEEDLLDA